MTRVFVYGSLLQGGSNHHLLEGSTFVGAAKTANLFTLHDLGDYPGLSKKRPGTYVSGEVYDVDADTLVRLDLLESCPRFYNRIEVLVKGTNGEYSKAQTYILSTIRPDAPVVTSGDWRKYLEGARR